VPAATVADLAGMGGTLAYKFMSDEPGKGPAWKLAVATEAVEPWVRAEVANQFTFNPVEAGLVQGRAVVRYDIQNAPVKEFSLAVPAAARNVEIAGEGIRRKDASSNHVWRVELQSRVSGVHVLTVTWDQPFALQEAAFRVQGVQALGVERESGTLAIRARAPFQVSEKTVGGDVVRTDVKDLPAWAGQGEEATVLAYRYLKPGYALDIGVQRFEDAEVLNALVDKADLVSVISEDGQMMTELTLSVRSSARQHLEMRLPPGAEVWSAFVNGIAVRPSVRDQTLLLPLERAGADDQVVRVELTSVGHVQFPHKRGVVQLVSPTLDMPVKDARWDLFVPPDYEYARFRGSMMRESEAKAEKQVFAFTLSEYSELEGQKAKARKSMASVSLARARKELGENRYLNAKLAYDQVEQTDGEESQQQVAELKKDMKQAQGLNVLNAQRDYYAKQTSQSQPQQVMQTRDQTVNEEYAAAQQWERLQQAQELGQAKVLPLHVSLPRRGVRLAFTQALQTEAGRPMTVEFRAVNSRGISAPLALAGGLGGFLALWIALALLLRRRAAA
jgi:hypothetical protein